MRGCPGDGGREEAAKFMSFASDKDALAATACKRKTGGAVAKPKATAAVVEGVKKKRGRPQGSRNKKTLAKLAANQGGSSNPAATKRAKTGPTR